MKHITICLTLCATSAIAQDIKSVDAAFKVARFPKEAPALSLLHRTPPTPIVVKVESPTLIHFWATWCAPCVEELPSIAKIYTKTQRLKFIFVSVDTSAVTKVPPFLNKINLSHLPVYWDPRSDLYKKFGIQILPTSILLNEKGIEVGRISGAANWKGEEDVIFLLNKISTP